MIIDELDNHRHRVVNATRAAVAIKEADDHLDLLDVLELREERLVLGPELRIEITPGTGELEASDGVVERAKQQFGGRAVVEIDRLIFRGMSGQSEQHSEGGGDEDLTHVDRLAGYT